MKKKTIIDCFALIHLQYLDVDLSTIDNKLLATLELHSNWAVKACFNRKQNYSSIDLKMQNSIWPISNTLNYRGAGYKNKYSIKFETSFFTNRN